MDSLNNVQIKSENQAELVNPCFAKEAWIIVDFYLPNGEKVGLWNYSYRNLPKHRYRDNPVQTEIFSKYTDYFEWQKSEGPDKHSWAKIVLRCKVDEATCKQVAGAQ